MTIGTARERRRRPEKDSEKPVCLWMEQSDMNEEKRVCLNCVVVSLEDACRKTSLVSSEVKVMCVLFLTREKQRERVGWVWEP